MAVTSTTDRYEVVRDGPDRYLVVRADGTVAGTFVTRTDAEAFCGRRG